MEEVTATIAAQATINGDAEATPIRYIADADLTELIGTKVDEYVEEHSGGFATETQVSILEDFVSSHNDNFAPAWVKTQDYPAGVLIMDTNNNGALYISKGFTASQVTDCANLNEVMIKGYVTGYSVAELKTDFERSQYVQNVDIANLKAAAKGVLYNEQTDSTISRTKTVPTGALPYGSLAILGGMSRKGKNLCEPLKVNSALASWNGSAIVLKNSTTRWDTAPIAKVEMRKGVEYKFSYEGYIGKYRVGLSSSSTYAPMSASSVGVMATQVLEHLYPKQAYTATENVTAYLWLCSDRAQTMTQDEVIYFQVETSADYTTYEPYTDSLIDAKVDKVEWLGKYRFNLNDWQINWFTNNQDIWNNNKTVVVFLNSTLIRIISYKSDTTLTLQNMGAERLTSKYDISESTDSLTYKSYYGTTPWIYLYGKNGYVDVDSVSTIGIPEKVLTTIPATVIAKCPDYGIGINENCYNYIDFEQKTYTKQCNKANATSVYSILKTVNGSGLFGVELLNGVAFFEANQLLINHYETKKFDSTSSGNWNVPEFNTAIIGWTSNPQRFAIWLKDITTVEQANAYLVNNPLECIYELATKEVIDLSDVWVDGIEMLEVEAGGEIAFHYPQLDDGYEVDMPNSETYLIDLSEVI